MSDVKITELPQAILRQVNKDLYARAGRAMEYLVQQIKRAYAKEFTASRGAAGAIGGIQSELRLSSAFIEATIGVTKNAAYLANLEFGEHGTDGSPVGGALFTRTKAPPVKSMYQWLKRATASLDADKLKHYTKLALIHKEKKAHKRKKGEKAIDWSKPWMSTDPLMLWASAAAIMRKKFGTPAMHIIEKTIKAHSDKIVKYLEADSPTSGAAA